MNDKTTPAEVAGTVRPMVRREVRIDMDRKAYGQPWDVRCDLCPMKPYTDALGQAAPICAAGIMTNLQGAVPLRACQHYGLESICSDDRGITIECGHTPNNRL